MFKCVSCGGSGCESCRHTGTFELDRCPNQFIDDDTSLLVNTYGPLFDKGLPPVSGGVLDQCGSFISAHMFYSSERAYWKAKLINKG